LTLRVHPVFLPVVPAAATAEASAAWTLNYSMKLSSVGLWGSSQLERVFGRKKKKMQEKAGGLDAE
jgi:hypothetical protein